MGKLEAIRYTNQLLVNRIKAISEALYPPTNESENFSAEIKYQTSNEETVTNLIKLKAGMKSKMLVEGEFKRLVCIKGVIKIHYIYPFNEDRILTSPNTQLIVPETSYIIECIEDAELLTVHKPKKKGQRYIISEQQTIYKKL